MLSEEVLLVRLVLERKGIIESKSTDSQTNETKELAWDEVTKLFQVECPALMVSEL